jgi:hypothetical protein
MENQKNKHFYAHTQGWPEPCICGVYTNVLAGKSPNIYTQIWLWPTHTTALVLRHAQIALSASLFENMHGLVCTCVCFHSVGHQQCVRGLTCLKPTCVLVLTHPAINQQCVNVCQLYMSIVLELSSLSAVRQRSHLFETNKYLMPALNILSSMPDPRREG